MSRLLDDRLYDYAQIEGYKKVIKTLQAQITDRKNSYEMLQLKNYQLKNPVSMKML